MTSSCITPIGAAGPVSPANPPRSARAARKTAALNVTLPMPSADIPVVLPHKLALGGGELKIKHTHPTYDDHEQRLERLREMKKLCLTLARPGQREKRVS